MKTTPLFLLALAAASFLLGGCTVLEVADREDMRRGAGGPTAIVYVNEAGPLSTQEMRDRRIRVEDYLVANGYLTGREVIVGRTSQADRVIRVVLEADGGFSFSVYLPEEIDTRVAYASGYYGVRSYFPDHYYSSAYFYDPYWHAGYYFDSTPVLYFSPSVWWSSSYRPNYRHYNPGYPGRDRGGYSDNHRGDGDRGTRRPSTYHGTPGNTASQPPNWTPGSTPQHGTDNPNMTTSGRPRGTKPSSGGLWANRAREDAAGALAGATSSSNQQVQTDSATTATGTTSRPAYSNSNRSHNPRPYASGAANESSGRPAYGHRAAPNYSGGAGGSSSSNPPPRREYTPPPRQDHGSAPRRDYTPTHSAPPPSYSSSNNNASSSSSASSSNSSRSSEGGHSRSSSPPPHKEFVPKQPEN